MFVFSKANRACGTEPREHRLKRDFRLLVQLQLGEMLQFFSEESCFFLVTLVGNEAGVRGIVQPVPDSLRPPRGTLIQLGRATLLAKFLVRVQRPMRKKCRGGGPTRLGGPGLTCVTRVFPLSYCDYVGSTF